VYIERRPASAPREDCALDEPLMFSGQDTAQAERPCAEQALAPWAVYDSVQAVDSLIGYLNPQGQRESALKRVRLQLRLLIFMADVVRPHQTAPLLK